MSQHPLFTRPPVVSHHVFSLCRHDRHDECPVYFDRRPSIDSLPMRHEVCTGPCHEATE